MRRCEDDVRVGTVCLCYTDALHRCYSRGKGRREDAVQWVTRARPKTDRIACPWLIRKFIDPDADIVYVPAEQVLEFAGEHGGHSFDAPGAEFTHRDGKCTFEVLIEDFALDDRALHRLAAIVHGADISGEIDATPQSAGLLAIAEGFTSVEADDQKLLAMESPVYDALYAWCQSNTEDPHS
jgi:hypothetical protein